MGDFTPFCVFEPPLGGLRAMYDDHLSLIGKRVVDFLWVLIELFRRCYSWGATSIYQLKIGYFTPTAPVDQKFQVEGYNQKFQTERVAPINPSSSQKTKLNDLCNGIKIKTDLSSVLSQITRLTDGQTGRQYSHC